MSYERRQIAIFTTASLPWLTGTAINPLFRAAYLAKCGKWKVSLVIPWLSSNDQDVVYPGKISFASPGEHERYVRRWLEDRTGFSSGFQIRFYPAKVIFLAYMRNINIDFIKPDGKQNWRVSQL